MTKSAASIWGRSGSRRVGPELSSTRRGERIEIDATFAPICVSHAGASLHALLQM